MSSRLTVWSQGPLCELRAPTRPSSKPHTGRPTPGSAPRHEEPAIHCRGLPSAHGPVPRTSDLQSDWPAGPPSFTAACPVTRNCCPSPRLWCKDRHTSQSDVGNKSRAGGPPCAGVMLASNPFYSKKKKGIVRGE